jgi:hypothetical protein
MTRPIASLVLLGAVFLGANADAQPRRNRRTPTATGDAGTATTPASTGDDAGTPADPVTQFDALLRAVVRSSGVNYSALRARSAELVAFHTWLATHGPSTTPAEFSSGSARKAYWLNAYNATVLRGVVEAPASMNNVINYLPNNGFFRGRRWRIDGRERTLDEIENRDVRDVFHDARVHFALNCGARSCPPLRAGAYRADRVDGQLNEQVRRFFAQPNAIVIDEAARTVRLVQLFEWFRDDFAARVPGHPASPVQGALGFVHTFAPPAVRTQIETVCGADGARCTITVTPYDWTLNSAR